MRTNIDQDAVDEKIHQFLARKSPIKTLSETIAERLVPVRLKRRKSGISYEPMQWSGNGVAHSH